MRRIALVITLVSVAIWALLAIIALLGAELGDTHWKIVITSVLITTAAAVALASAIPLHAGHLGYVPWLGIGSSIIGFGMVILGVWADMAWDGAVKTAASLVIAAVAVAAIGLIDGARLRAEHHWATVVTQSLVAFGGAMLIAAVWGEIENAVFWRLAGVVLVLAAAGAVAVPILHRIADIPRNDDPDAVKVAHCPFCGGEAHGRLASMLVCPHCEARFRVLI